VRQVQAQPGEVQVLGRDRMVVQKSGFLYVYTSNETPQDVYFDEVMVVNLPGPVLEETHYYPFGLTMAGISAKASGKLENKYKYNGIEKIGDLGLEDYDAKFRELDPQIGRWWQIDPKPNDGISLYAAMDNNPIRYSDFLGDTIIVDKKGYVIKQYGDDNLVFLQRGKKLKGIGELGKTINANKIFKNFLNSNITIAKGIVDPRTFRNLVKNKGEWDIKNNTKTIYGLANQFDKGKETQTQFSFQGSNYTAPDLGNFNYGATGKAVWLFHEELLLRNAGNAQMAAGTSRLEWQKYESRYLNAGHGEQREVRGSMLPPYGDDPVDQHMIKQGFKYYNSNNGHLEEED
jgi:RHS repeat-associated protein